MADLIKQNIVNKALQDKFLLVLDVPKVMKDEQSNTARSKNLVNLDKLQFSVIGTVVPTVSIPNEELRYLGQSVPVTSQSRPMYPPVKVNFKVDNNFDNYWVLWKWLAILNKPRESGMDSYFAEFKRGTTETLDNTRTGGNNVVNEVVHKASNMDLKYKHITAKNPYLDYQTTITIYGLREYNEKIVQFNYYNAFITSLGEITYDYRTPDEISCSFNFVFGQLDVSLIDP